MRSAITSYLSERLCSETLHRKAYVMIHLCWLLFMELYYKTNLIDNNSNFLLFFNLFCDNMPKAHILLPCLQNNCSTSPVLILYPQAEIFLLHYEFIARKCLDLHSAVLWSFVLEGIEYYLIHQFLWFYGNISYAIWLSADFFIPDY